MANHNLPVMDERSASGQYAHVKRLPDLCPQCHHRVEPQYLVGFRRLISFEGTQSYEFQAAFRCPRQDCSRLFIAEYIGPTSAQSSEGVYELIATAPKKFVARDFPQKIKEVSPSFVEIFNEAAHTESLQLLHIAGPGYRKGLEFLIKDFLIHLEPDKEEVIKNMALQNAISNKVTDANVKTCAQRAAWLGNDETHYERVWSNHDLEDLKRLVTLTVNWIESTLITRAYEQEMQPPTKL